MVNIYKTLHTKYKDRSGSKTSFSGMPVFINFSLPVVLRDFHTGSAKMSIRMLQLTTGVFYAHFRRSHTFEKNNFPKKGLV